MRVGAGETSFIGRSLAEVEDEDCMERKWAGPEEGEEEEEEEEEEEGGNKWIDDLDDTERATLLTASARFIPLVVKAFSECGHGDFLQSWGHLSTMLLQARPYPEPYDS